MSIADRLREVRDRKGLGRKSVAERLGIAATTIQNYESGRYSPKADFLVDFAREMEVDPAWLFAAAYEDESTDQQISGNDETASQDVSEPREPFAPSMTARRDQIAALPAPFDDSFRLIVYTHIHASAGAGLFGWEPTGDEDTVEIDESKRLIADLLGFWPDDGLRGIRVKGISMRRRYGGIEDGQIVLYQPTRSADDVADGARHVLAVSEGDESRILVKRVQLLFGGGLRLIADNPASGVMDEVLLPGDDCLVNQLTGQSAHIQFLGRVVWPDEFADEAAIRVVGQTIESLIARGFLPPPPPVAALASG